MYKQIIINVAKHETRVALLEDGTIAEFFVERKDESEIAGNVYKGRVQRVLPGMQAAFVDIGLNQAAFIYVDDVVDDNLSEIEAMFTEEFENGDVFEPEAQPQENSSAEVPAASEPAGKPHENSGGTTIEDLITEGQDILVQVVKSPMGTKGARISSHISLPGRFLVLMPTSNHIGISRRIEDTFERERLKEIVRSMRTEPLGYIVRTAAEGITAEKLSYEMGFLNNLWKNVRKRYDGAPSPAVLHQELSVSLRAVRDLLLQEAERLIIDNREGYESILSFLDTCMPSLKDSVVLWDGPEPIFDAYNLEGDISRALKRKIWLKSGGYIVIEHTEALVAIDVNTGRYVGKYNLEETITKTNLEAVKEIAYQIRLRDIGGIIIIDFIDMERVSNQERVFNALKETLKKDRSKTHVLPMSEMGLIQMTRKRIRKPLTGILCEPCFYCDGEGYVVSKKTICYNIYRAILREAQNAVGAGFTLRANPAIAELLHEEEKGLIGDLEKRIGKRIVIYPNPKLHMEEFDILESLE